MANDTTRKPPGSSDKPLPATEPSRPGRVAEDDRGNMTWEWARDEALQSDDTAGAIERLRVLVDPTLVVVDDDPPNSLKQNPQGLKVGYNPYDSGALGKTARMKKLNLRELSKWIEAKHKVAEKKDGDE